MLATGPDYLRARYYDPSTAQFISRDPAVATTRQPYAYVNDNPVNASDPSGLYNCGWQVWNCITNPFTDPAQGQRNFVDNFSAGGWIGVVGPLGLAGGLAGAGLAEGIYASGAAVAAQASAASAVPLGALTQLQQNAGAGAAWEQELANEFESNGYTVAQQVPKMTPFGKRIMDLQISLNGQCLGGIEAKAGNAVRSASQFAKDEWLSRNGYPVQVARQ